MKKVNTEQPDLHWEFVNVTECVVLDLGCGRWEHVEYREKTWPTTPEYFISKGASRVYALDADNNEIKWFREKFAQDNRYLFEPFYITSANAVEQIIQKVKPDCIKCDIEGGEEFLFSINKEVFNSVKEYYIETHNDRLFNMALSTFNKQNYKIRETIDLTHTNGICKVVFAYRD
jgi:hypothetical protein